MSATQIKKKGNTIKNGVIYNSIGRPIAYRVLGKESGDDRDISTRNMIHVFNPNWHEQGRGLMAAVHAIDNLLSAVKSEEYDSIRKKLEADSDNRVVDMHLFRIGSQRMVGIISIATHYPRKVEHYKSLLDKFKNLAHVTVEVNVCEGESCVPNTCSQ